MDAIRNLIASRRQQNPQQIYYVLSALDTMTSSVINATYVLFLLSHGLNLFQVNLTNVGFHATHILTELITGAYADKHGRRRALVISSSIWIVGTGLYFAATGFWVFLVAEILAAIANTFSTGALKSWLLDHLDTLGRKADRQAIFTANAATRYLAGGAAGLIGSQIGLVNLALPFAASAVVAALELTATLVLLDEPTVHHKVNEAEESILTLAWRGAKYGIKHTVMLWLVVGAMAFYFAVQPLNMFWAPRFTSLGLSLTGLGIVVAAIPVIMFIGSWLTARLHKRGWQTYQMLILMAIICGTLVLASNLSPIAELTVAIFLAHEMGRGMFDPLNDEFVTRHVGDEGIRTTVFSFQSMMAKVGSTSGLLVFGLVADHWSIVASWMIAGAVLLLLAPIYLQAHRKERRLNHS